MQDEDEIYDNGYQAGYKEGISDSKDEYEYKHDRAISEMEDEYHYQLKDQEIRFLERIDVLGSHLRIKDEEIETYLNEIYELRKANAELQRTIAKNS